MEMKVPIRNPLRYLLILEFRIVILPAIPTTNPMNTLLYHVAKRNRVLPANPCLIPTPAMQRSPSTAPVTVDNTVLFRFMESIFLSLDLNIGFLYGLCVSFFCEETCLKNFLMRS